MKVQRTDYGALAVLSPHGDLAGDEIDVFRQETRHCLDGGGADLIVDCGGVGGFDSAGLECLTELSRECRERGGGLKLCGLDAVGRKIFEITRLMRHFEIFDDVEDAIRSCT